MGPLRLRFVLGFDGRINDTLFQPAAVRPTSLSPRDQQTLVYFGGDIQDYPEEMYGHRDNRNYMHWSLESTAEVLGQNFPDQHILVIRPSRIQFKSFSCYDNFVPSNNAGVPDHTPTHSALRHLERLLQSVSGRLRETSTAALMKAVASTEPENIAIEELHNAGIPAPAASDLNGTQAQGSPAGSASGVRGKTADKLWWRTAVLEQSRLTLVGFSKGCVVLNQLLYEFHYAKTLTPGDLHTCRFISRVAAMIWLDGGHAGGKNTWLTSRSLLETLTHLDMEIYIHVSPYQVKDEMRPWIGREERAFTAMLKKLGAKVSRFMHAGGPPYNLHTHFNIIGNFKRVQDAAARGEWPDEEQNAAQDDIQHAAQNNQQNAAPKDKQNAAQSDQQNAAQDDQQQAGQSAPQNDA